MEQLQFTYNAVGLVDIFCEWLLIVFSFSTYQDLLFLFAVFLQLLSRGTPC